MKQSNNYQVTYKKKSSEDLYFTQCRYVKSNLFYCDFEKSLLPGTLSSIEVKGERQNMTQDIQAVFRRTIFSKTTARRGSEYECSWLLTLIKIAKDVALHKPMHFIQCKYIIKAQY